MAVSGSWRRPRMKVYDYNQDFGGNYYQPMIEYLNTKDIYGPYHKKVPVYMPDRAEVVSQKYSNMRYKDKSSAKQKMDTFLEDAYTKQIKESNGTTAHVHYNQLHDAASGRKLTTPFTDRKLLGDFDQTDRCRRYYLRELGLAKAKEERRDREEYGDELIDQIKQRNRLCRIREACRDILMDNDCYREPYTANDYYPLDSPTEANFDPILPTTDTRDRLHLVRKGLLDQI